jgi:hypothetical protein
MGGLVFDMIDLVILTTVISTFCLTTLWAQSQFHPHHTRLSSHFTENAPSTLLKPDPCEVCECVARDC